MDRSRLSNIVSVTRLLPHFSSENVDVMKSCVFEQLGCENEGQFLCKALQSLYKTLSIESLSKIKKKAVQIADSQNIQLSPYQTTTNSNDICINRITVYKYVQQKYTDPLSKLHSDIIDYFNTFLSKKQSIELGYLNKQLYIETQKHSYLAKRCMDKNLYLQDDHLGKMILTQSDAFDYSFAKDLTLSMNKPVNVSKIVSFNNFFRRLNSLKCHSLLSLSYVPVDILFNSRHNFHRDSSSNHITRDTYTLNELYIQECSGNITKKCIDQMSIFCDNLKSCDNMNKHIGELQLLIPSYRWDSDEQTHSHYEMVKKLLLSCGCVAQSIYLLENTKTKIDNQAELTQIFHNDLTHLTLGGDASLIIKIDKKNTDIGRDEKQATDKNKKFQIGMLNTIAIEATGYQKEITNLLDTLKSFDIFEMRRNVQCYSVDWNPFYRALPDPVIDPTIKVLNKIFFQDYDKHPLLREIKITCYDDNHLFNLAKLLYYFNQHYQKLFVERKAYLKHFEKIEVNFEKVNTDTDGLIEPLTKAQRRGCLSSMFGQTSNQEYPVGKKVIEIKHVKQGIESFAVIYQNIVAWLKARQIQHGKQCCKDAIKHCKVVFVVTG